MAAIRHRPRAGTGQPRTAVLEGDPLPDDFVFDAERIIVGCGWSSQPPTRLGERLAVYLQDAGDGQRQEVLVLPLSYAILADPIVRRLATQAQIAGNSDWRSDLTPADLRAGPMLEPVATPDL